MLLIGRLLQRCNSNNTTSGDRKLKRPCREPWMTRTSWFRANPRVAMMAFAGHLMVAMTATQEAGVGGSPRGAEHLDERA